MGKLLLLAAVAFAIYLLWKVSRSGSEPRAQKPPEIERMVRCRHCGVHLPLGEAVAVNDEYFCSEEHYRGFIARPRG